MSNITIFSGDFCKGGSVVKELLDRTGYKLITDKDITARAVILSGLNEQRIERAFSSKASVFDKFTHEKERALAYLRLAMAEMSAEHNLLITGFLGQIIPREITHFLKVCIIGDLKFRVSVAASEEGLSEKEAVKLIGRTDAERANWINILHGIEDPWHSTLYDMVIPMAGTSAGEAASLIEDYLKKEAVKPTSSSGQAVKDFLLAAQCSIVLAREGHNVDVAVKSGLVTLTINKNVLMLNRLVDELKSIVNEVPGVISTEVNVGKGFHKADIYRKFDFDSPSKVLLVDDEREFVQTLSERLILRDMGSVVAYDGQSALEMLADDEPDVLVLDLRMPGIDGIEVLRRVKKMRPEVEVIILTGHGTEKDRKTCMQLGAFAYIQKPVDIDQLTAKLKEANEKVRQRKKPSH